MKLAAAVCGLLFVRFMQVFSEDNIKEDIEEPNENNSSSPLDLCDSSEASNYTMYSNRKRENCGCEKEPLCVRKCCQSGFYHHYVEDPWTWELLISECKRNYSNKTSSFSVGIYDGEKKVYNFAGKFMVGILDCKNPKWQYFNLSKSIPNEQFYVQRNGSLYFPDSDTKIYDNSRYCLEEDGITAYVCYTPEPLATVGGRKVNCTGMIISMPFLLITFLVYAILPDPNLHRKALMFYVLTLLLSYILLVTVQLYEGKIEDSLCETLGYSVIFFFIGSFFWMNVMCIDMWLAFSGMRGFNGQKHAERKRFLIYCVYAWGMPVLHVLIVFLVNQFGNKDSQTYPGVGRAKCFLDDGIPNLLYFYGPVAIITAVNITMFILTAVKIQKVKKETSVLKHSDSKRHSYENDKQKFQLYLKLLLAMGVNWTMEIISWAFLWKMGSNMPSYVWYLTDFINAMYGVFIFFIFVFKKKIWKSLQKSSVNMCSISRCYWKSSTETITTGLSTPHLSSNKSNKSI